ncbi:protein LOL2 isoform X2 [Rosa chinensis]|uniref:protein LOL2 isoform X2 n=1 Tax=Rosa chinensis TaxID=74649 RepID=UPI000D088F83|nr:protein LOL2 isoform X2 [Rosa chinensis]
METKVQQADEAPPPEAQPIVSQPPPPPLSAQMVCGSCRHLLTYPPGAKHVQCSCCQTVNFVLEAHQVGQVKCGSCTTLLMYPYGALSVRCSSCSFVTEVRDHNMRPPWSAQQGQPTPPSNSVH